MTPLQRISMVLALATGVGLLTNDANAVESNHLSEIRSLVKTNNIRGLMSFIARNPQVLDSSPLGQSLSDFANDPPDAVERFFGAGIPGDLSSIAERSSTDSSLY
ncbi:hypothetical protein [Roseibium sp.]|uniref:hypothetical protein n=1 Tax=Roseibium sp. TaxID=1936156 RepID=UPI003D14D724